MIPKAPKAALNNPPARPSRPSEIFTALLVATIAKINNGTIQ